MLSFAIKTLLADKRKLYIALMGVIFSLVLATTQGGLFLGMIAKATKLIDNGKADIWVGHRGVQNPDITASIPENWVYRIREIEGVQEAEPLIVFNVVAKLSNGSFESVLVVGFDPTTKLGAPWDLVEGSVEDLRELDAISIDQQDLERLDYPKIGDVIEINGARARVAAITNGIVGFITTPFMFTSISRARSYAPVPEGMCSFFLVSVKPGTDVQQVVAEIRSRLPHADVQTSKEFSDGTKWYWVVRAGLGMAFGSSTALGLLVGLVMVAQSLYAFVLDHIEQYAALKAIGASDWQIACVLVIQSLTIACVGCAIGHVISWAIRTWGSTPKMAITVTPFLLVLATCMSISICLISALLPLARIRRVDPAMVLQG